MKNTVRARPVGTHTSTSAFVDRTVQRIGSQDAYTLPSRENGVSTPRKRPVLLGSGVQAKPLALDK